MGRDRTQEFFSACESLSMRSDNAHTRLMGGNTQGGGGNRTRGEFTKAASLISKEINDTVTRLTKLTTLAKRKGMFEDKPMEINELIYIIKQDIAKINHQIGQLADYFSKQAQDSSSIGSGGGPTSNQNNKQIKEHSHNVITSLQSKLANTSDTFKSVLKVRSDNLKLQKERRDQYSFSNQEGSSPSFSTSSGGGIGAATDSPLYHPERRPTRDVYNNNSSPPVSSMVPNQSGASGGPYGSGPSSSQQSNSSFFAGSNPNISAPPLPPYSNQSNGGASSAYSNGPNGDAVIDFGGSFVQQTLMEPSQNSAYLEARDQTIESIESTIAELGQVYSRFASVLAEQREMVQRIDDNIGDVQMNVEGAHGQLLKYYQGISSNRGLMVKSFAVVVVFFTLFTVLT